MVSSLHIGSGLNDLVFWCSQNNMELNMLKTVEMMVEFRTCPITISNDPVPPMETIKILGNII